MAKRTFIISQLRQSHDDGHTLRYTRSHLARLEGAVFLAVATVGAVGMGALVFLIEETFPRIIVGCFPAMCVGAFALYGLFRLLNNITVEVDAARGEIRCAVGVGPLGRRRVFQVSDIEHIAVGEAEDDPFDPESRTYYCAWVQCKQDHAPTVWHLDQSRERDHALAIAQQVANRLGVALEAAVHESAKLKDTFEQHAKQSLRE